MTPYGIILLIALVVLIFVIIFIISNKIKKTKEIRNNQEELVSGERICIHTSYDCENCVVSSKCRQRNGKGLLGQ